MVRSQNIQIKGQYLNFDLKKVLINNFLLYSWSIFPILIIAVNFCDAFLQIAYTWLLKVNSELIINPSNFTAFSFKISASPNLAYIHFSPLKSENHTIWKKVSPWKQLIQKSRFSQNTTLLYTVRALDSQNWPLFNSYYLTFLLL